MNPLTLLLIRLAFLAVLWLFVIAAVGVVRTDLFGPSRRSRQGAAAAQATATAEASSRRPAPGRVTVAPPQRLLVTARGLAGTTIGLSRPANHHWPGK